MISDWLLFILRIASGIALLAILLTILYFFVQEVRQTAKIQESARRVYGRLSTVDFIGPTAVLSGTSFPLYALTTIGRSPSSTIPIDDSFASTDHAALELRAGQWWLEDKGSTNGTLLNEIPVDQPVIVTNGDIVTVGKTHFRLDLES
jgi:pSer/pThr/pTyr-binding forkhead associated (FHA) protein